MSGPPLRKTTTTPNRRETTMPNHRTLELYSSATQGSLQVRTLVRDPDDDPDVDDVLIFQTTRGASIWLGIADVTALVNFGRAEVIAWEAERNQPDEVPDAHIVCGFEWHDGRSRKTVSCGLADGHVSPFGPEGKAYHITSDGTTYDEVPF